MPVEAVKREIHLTKGRLAKQLVAVLHNQGAVRRNVHAKALLMRNIEQLMNARMQERLSLDMQINMIRMRLNLIERMREILDRNKLRFALCRRAEAARQITYARNLNIYFLKRLQSMFSILSILKTR